VSLRVVEPVSKTDVGRQRSTNEDAYLESPPVFAVADGMGGAQAGEVASKIAMEMLAEGGTGGEADLATVAEAANRRIFDLAQEDESRSGMGTTFTAVIVSDGEVATAHVGDSRLYRFREGQLERLTRDHSLVEELVRRGELDPEDVESHPQRAIITRALGPAPEVEVETFTSRGRDGDVYLLCSDGLTSMVAEDRVAEILRSRSSLEDAANRMVNTANESGGRDNVTVVLFRLAEEAREVEADTLSGSDTRADMRVTEVKEAVAASRDRASAETVRPERPRPARARGRRRAITALVALVLVAGVGAGLYLGARQVYFLGLNEQGFVSIYRGVPYDFPAGVATYEPVYTSPVPAAALEGRRREAVLDHSLRSRTEATEVIESLERDHAAARAGGGAGRTGQGGGAADADRRQGPSARGKRPDQRPGGSGRAGRGRAR
jgi:protein phosphatase